MFRFILVLVSILLLVSCGDKAAKNAIEDLPFETADNAKEYADIVLKAIRTNRDAPLYKELASSSDIDYEYFNSMIGMYSTGVGGRKDWEFRDVYEENEGKNKTSGYDFAWLDPRGRLGIQIYIEPILVKGRYKIDKLELRSRLEVMESVSFPGGDIDDYKKLAFNWDDK